MLRNDEKLWPSVAEGWVAEQNDEKLWPSVAEGWVAEQHLLGSEEPREVLVERLDPALVTNASMVNLHVSGETGMLAVVHLGGGAGASRILAAE